MKFAALFGLSVGLASTAVAAPARKSKCGSHLGSHSSQPLTYSPATSAGYLGSGPSTCYVWHAPTGSSYPTATGTACTLTTIVIETSTISEATKTKAPDVTITVTDFEVTTATTTIDETAPVFISTSTITETVTSTNTEIPTLAATETSTTTITVAAEPTTLGTSYTAVKAVYADENPEKRTVHLPISPVTITSTAGRCTSTATSATTTTTITTVIDITSLPAETTTTTSINTVTTVSTVLVTPAETTSVVTETDTFTELTTITSTGTITETKTSTETVGPTPTIWAPCVDADNYMRSINGELISGDSFAWYGDINFDTANDATDCCIKCHDLLGGSCAGSHFSDGSCTYFSPFSDCDAESSEEGFFPVDPSGGSTGVVSNGACGQWGKGQDMV